MRISKRIQHALERNNEQTINIMFKPEQVDKLAKALQVDVHKSTMVELSNAIAQRFGLLPRPDRAKKSIQDRINSGATGIQFRHADANELRRVLHVADIDGTPALAAAIFLKIVGP